MNVATIESVTIKRMCDKCKGFSERFKIKGAREYLDLVRQLEELVAASTFWIVQGTCPLNEVFKVQKWADDVIIHTFECSHCGQRFKLAVDTYHGAGGTWEMINKAEPISSEIH